MPQISLYIDEKTLKKVERAATQEHLSISRWVAEQIKTKVDPEYTTDFKNLFGSITDSSFQAPLELQGKTDSLRKKF